MICNNKLGNHRATIRPNKDGFTIVELLVVIVVIGILAAITIVSYSGISNRATVASLQSDLDSVSKQLKLYGTLYSSFPTAFDANNCPTAPTSDTSYCLKASSGTSYQFQSNNSVSPQTFCITATKGSYSYFVSQNGQPTSGGCSGDWVAGVPAVVNLVTNPSLEVDLSGWGSWSSNGGGHITITRDNTYAQYGSWSLRYVADGSVSSQQATSPSGSGFVVGDVAKAIVSVYSVSGGESIRVQINELNGSGSYLTSGQSSAYVLSAGWNSLSYVRTLSNSSVARAQAIVVNNLATPITVWVDGVMLIKGTSTTGYADGSFRNWTWSGTANNSTSSGPAY